MNHYLPTNMILTIYRALRQQRYKWEVMEIDTSDRYIIGTDQHCRLKPVLICLRQRRPVIKGMESLAVFVMVVVGHPLHP